MTPPTRPTPFEPLCPTAVEARAWARWAWDRTRFDADPPPSGSLPVDTLRAWRLGPLVYAALSAAGDERRAPLRGAATEAAGSNLVRGPVLRELLARFDETGIRYALYKGAALVEHFPELRPLRTVSDADVLVRPDDFRRARRVLRRAGLREVRAPEPVSIGWNNERVFLRDTPPELHIDLHKGLHRPPLFASLSEHLVRSAGRHDGLWLAAPELTPLVVAAHRAKHGFTGDGRELLDFRVAVEAMSERDVRALPRLAERHQMLGALYAVWTVVRWWFGHGGAAEEAAYSEAASKVEPFREPLDLLASLDSPFEDDKPWRRVPFLKMYLPMPLLTDHSLAPFRLAATHAALRTADVLVGGPRVLYSVAARRALPRDPDPA